MIVTIKGSEVQNKEDLHNQLKEKLNLPDHYGENLDALWDCLTGHIDTSITIYWEDFSTSEKVLGEYAQKVLEILTTAEKEVKA